MLHESILKLYRRLRLDGYRKLFGAVQEREGSLSAMEAFSTESLKLVRCSVRRSTTQRDI